MEGKSIIGLCVQTLIWISILYIKYDKYEIYDFPDSFLIVILAITLFIYFYELMWNSSINSILSKKLKPVRSKLEIIRFLTQSKPYFEVTSRAYHYNYEKVVISYERTQLFDFEDIKDCSIVKFMNIYSQEIVLDNKFTVIDINLFIKFMDASCQEELDGQVQKIKNEDSFRDKYYDCRTKFVFRHLEDQENVFMFENQTFWFASKGWMILFYVLLVGEFYKIYFESLLHRCTIDLVKQINRAHPKRKLGQFITYQNFCEREEDSNDNTPADWKLTRQPSNGSRKVSAASGNNNNRLSPINNGEGVPLIDNYDPLFDVQPMATPMCETRTKSDKPFSKDNLLEFTKIDDPFIESSISQPTVQVRKANQETESDKNWSMPFVPSLPNKEITKGANKTSSYQASSAGQEKQASKLLSGISSNTDSKNMSSVKPAPSNNITTIKSEKVGSSVDKAETHSISTKSSQNFRYDQENKTASSKTPSTIKEESKQTKNPKPIQAEANIKSSTSATTDQKVYEKKKTIKQSITAATFEPEVKKPTAKSSSPIEDLNKSVKSNSKVFNTSLGDSRMSAKYEEDSDTEKDYSQEIREEIFDMFDYSESDMKGRKKIKKVVKVIKK